MIPLTLVSALPAAQVADTVISVPVRDSFDMVFGITAGMIGVTLLGFFVVLVFLIVQANRFTRVLERASERLASDRGVEHLRRVAGNLEKISETLADEAEVIRGTGKELATRIERISDRMEDRIEEFNALMEVVQLEAEDAFVDTASTARGVRRGIGHLSTSGKDRDRKGRMAREKERPLTAPPSRPGVDSPRPVEPGLSGQGPNLADHPEGGES